MMNDPFKQYQDLFKSINEIGEVIKPYSQLQGITRFQSLELNKNIALAAGISQINPAIYASSVSEISKAIANAAQILGVNKAITSAIDISVINLGINLPTISSHLLAGEDVLNSSCKILEVIQKSQVQIAPSAALQQLKFLESFQQQTAIWQKLIQPNLAPAGLAQVAMPQIRAASVAWHSSLTQTINILQESKLLTTKPLLAARLLENSRVFTGFVESTIQRLEQTENQKIVRALDISLRLAEVQLVATTEALSSRITTSIDDEVDEVSDAPTLDLPFLQQEELIAAVESEDIEDEAALIELSPAANIYALSRQILSLITQCNEVVKVGEKPEIFKPTNKMLEVYADLPWLLPENKRTFGDFIDCLYFIFYEGAGKDKLRFLKAYGGVLEPADCGLIWCIKHLRNKWLRHDADHGKETDIRKSWKELSAKFSWLGLQHAPISQEHFRHLHSRLLEETDAFLQKILQKLIKDE